jgi:hypothetical protein
MSIRDLIHAHAKHEVLPTNGPFDREGLRAKAEKATRGEWHVCGANNGDCPCRLIWADEHETVCSLDTGLPDGTVRKEDWHYIAAASPNVVLALLDENEKLQGLLDTPWPVNRTVEPHHYNNGNGIRIEFAFGNEMLVTEEQRALEFGAALIRTVLKARSKAANALQESRSTEHPTPP